MAITFGGWYKARERGGSWGKKEELRQKQPQMDDGANQADSSSQGTTCE